MSHPVKLSAIFLFIIFSLISCKDEITNNYNDPEGGSPPDVNVVYSSYELGTIHSYHMDTSSYPAYNYILNLNLELDKPQNRNQINKIIIVNEDGFGWEFFGDELEEFYSDSLGGYTFTNLVFRFYSSSYTQQSNLFQAKLYSRSNAASEEYEFIIFPDFINISSSLNHGWYTQDIYQITFDYYYSSLDFSLVEVHWLNENKQEIGKSDFNWTDITNNYYLNVKNVPDDAYYFYFYLQKEENNIKSFAKSDVYFIEDRFPPNIQILGEYVYNMDVVKYIPAIQKILILDRNNHYIYIINFNTLELDNKISLNYAYSLTYSEYDNKIYIGCENGKLYSLSLTDSSPEFVKNMGNSYLNSIIQVSQYLIASCYDNTFRILDLSDNSMTIENSAYYYSCRNMIYNKTLKVMYGSTGYELLRFNFNPDSGLISNYKAAYSGSSGSYELILYPDDSKIITPGGYIYECYASMQNDLTSYTNMGQSFTSASFSNDNNNILALKRGDYYSYGSLSVIDKNNFEVKTYIEDFVGTPEYLTAEGDMIKIISEYDNRVAAELFSYSDIISGGMLLKSVKEKYYLSRKISF